MKDNDYIAVVSLSLFTMGTVRKGIVDQPDGVYESAPYGVRGDIENIGCFFQELIEKSGVEVRAYEEGNLDEVEPIKATQLAEENGVQLILPGDGSLLRLLGKARYRFASPGDRRAGVETAVALEQLDRLLFKSGREVTFDGEGESWSWSDPKTGRSVGGFGTRIQALKAMAEDLDSETDD